MLENPSRLLFVTCSVLRSNILLFRPSALCPLALGLAVARREKLWEVAECARWSWHALGAASGARPVTCQRSDFSGKGKEVPGVVSGAHIILYPARLFIAYRVWLRVWLCGRVAVGYDGWARGQS